MKTRHQDLERQDEGWRSMSPVNPTERLKAPSTLLSARFDFDAVAEIGDPVKAGIDPIINVTEKNETTGRKETA